MTASAQGFGGPVAVEAAFDDEGKITYIKIGDNSFAETPGLGARALEDEFQAQFIGKQMPLTLSDIDAIAGATYTTDAVIDAVNKAYESMAAQGPASGEAEAFTASAQGFAGPVAVTVNFDENGAIASIVVGDESFAETPGLGAKAKEEAFTAQFIGKTPLLDPGDIDAIASATVTSEAVLSAVNKAWEELTGK